MDNNKILLTFKDPDGVTASVDSYIQDLNESAKVPTSIRYDEKLRSRIMGKLSKWLEWDEYIHVEIDLDKLTARVLLKDED